MKIASNALNKTIAKSLEIPRHLEETFNHSEKVTIVKSVSSAEIFIKEAREYDGGSEIGKTPCSKTSLLNQYTACVASLFNDGTAFFLIFPFSYPRSTPLAFDTPLPTP
jgi:hypothetical protein